MPVAESASARLASIDRLRGMVMLLMLLDHVRETFFLHHPLGDPVDVAQVSPTLFAFRLLAHLCAPVFVFLAGLSAWLYASRATDGRRAASRFLATRGAFLVVLELTLVNFAWTLELPPTTLYLQVIWAIGFAMLALAALLWLPRLVLAALAASIVAGHNLLDGVSFPHGSAHVAWAVLHERTWLVLGDALRVRTSYPVLPWIGVIAFGYCAGPWFGKDTPPAQRRRLLTLWGAASLSAFVVLRAFDRYGDAPWTLQDDAMRTVMAFLNVTKYPPSLTFVLLTLGTGVLLLRLLETPRETRSLRFLATMGAAPMFFYLLHLYVLKLLYVGTVAIVGLNHGDLYGVDPAGWLPLIAAILAIVLYPPVAAFARLKARRRDLAWLRYF